MVNLVEGGCEFYLLGYGFENTYEQIHFLAIILIILPSFFMFANRKLSV